MKKAELEKKLEEMDMKLKRQEAKTSKLLEKMETLIKQYEGLVVMLEESNYEKEMILQNKQDGSNIVVNTLDVDTKEANFKKLLETVQIRGLYDVN